MIINKSKYWILYLGWSDAGHKYELGEKCLESSPAGRNLGVLVGSSLSTKPQRALEVQRASYILGCIKHSTSWGASSTASPAGLFCSTEPLSREYPDNIVYFELHVGLEKGKYHSGMYKLQVQPAHRAIL